MRSVLQNTLRLQSARRYPLVSSCQQWFELVRRFWAFNYFCLNSLVKLNWTFQIATKNVMWASAKFSVKLPLRNVMWTSTAFSVATIARFILYFDADLGNAGLKCNLMLIRHMLSHCDLRGLRIITKCSITITFSLA